MSIEPNAEHVRLAAAALYWMYDGIEERLKADEPGEVEVAPLPEEVSPEMMISILLIGATTLLKTGAIAAGVSVETFLQLGRLLADKGLTQMTDEAQS